MDGVFLLFAGKGSTMICPKCQTENLKTKGMDEDSLARVTREAQNNCGAKSRPLHSAVTPLLTQAMIP
jgi:hypothetical protein